MIFSFGLTDCAISETNESEETKPNYEELPISIQEVRGIDKSTMKDLIRL